MSMILRSLFLYAVLPLYGLWLMSTVRRRHQILTGRRPPRPAPVRTFARSYLHSCGFLMFCLILIAMSLVFTGRVP